MQKLRFHLCWTLLLCWAGLLSFSCTSPGPKGDPQLNKVPRVLVPYKSLGALSWKPTSSPLPSALKDAKRFVLGSQTGAGVLLGTDKGLFTFSNTEFTAVDKKAVRAIARWKGSYLAVARDKEVQFWDGVMHDSQLFEQQDKGGLLSLCSWNQNRLWFGTDNQLWLLQNKQLTGYKQFSGVQSISTWSKADRVVIRDKNNVFHLLKLEGQNLSSRKLGWDKVKFEQIVIGPDKRLWALAGGALYTEDDKSGWKQVLLPKDDKENTSATILRLAVSSETGHLWAMAAEAFYLLSPKGFWGRQKAPEIQSKAPALVQVGQFQSLWWLSNGKLWRLSATTGSSVSYSSDVAPFLKRNCHRCHGELGPGRKLLTLEQARENITDMIDSLEKGRMPPDKKPLEGGDVSLLKRWQKDGLKP
jgi:ligand-binding sensor domain-containing protein